MLDREEESPKEWLFALHAILKELFDRMVVTLWVLWGVRRKAIHENIFQPPSLLTISYPVLWVNCML